jgi:transcriptional regulator with XRE-family HTH domain
MDDSDLAAFLRNRREALQPEDVGLTRGQRRRTPGLRREEIASLAGMSSDYYARLERGSGPQPSEQMVAAIARALRLSLVERDHLFLLAGHGAPRRVLRSDHVSPGLMRVLDRLADTPAQVMSALGETLAQTPPAVALLGDQTRHEGMHRANVYRWFTDPASREVYRESDRPGHGRTFVAQLRRTLAQQGPGSPADAIVQRLLVESAEFAELWRDQQVGLSFEVKHFVNSEVGALELRCETLLDVEQQQTLLVFTAAPGSDSYDKLQLLTVIGAQRMGATSA